MNENKTGKKQEVEAPRAKKPTQMAPEGDQKRGNDLSSRTETDCGTSHRVD